MIKKVKRYKALRAGLKSQYDGSEWRLGKWRKTDCRGLCLGFNCSRRILDTINYVHLEILAEVEVRGKHFIGDDKETWGEMKIVKAWHWTKKDSVELAIYCAELVIDLWTKEYPNDDRPQKAIQAAKAWVDNPTEKNAEKAKKAAEVAKDAVWTVETAWAASWTPASAAEKAARDAADAAEKAAWAAGATAEAAAWAAGKAAKEAAWAAEKVAVAEKEAAWAAGKGRWTVEKAADAARKKIKDVIENWLKERVKTLTPYKE